MVLPKIKRIWKLEFKGKLENFNPCTSLDYWLKKSPAEKFREVTDLILQAQLIKGLEDKNVSGLLRTTAVLKRQ